MMSGESSNPFSRSRPGNWCRTRTMAAITPQTTAIVDEMAATIMLVMNPFRNTGVSAAAANHARVQPGGGKVRKERSKKATQTMNMTGSTRNAMTEAIKMYANSLNNV